MLKQTLWLFAALFLLAACGERPSEQLEIDMDDVDVGELRISPETRNEIIQNIASPIEVAALLKGLNIPYSDRYLADPESLPTNTSNFEMAFSLGVLNADLGYLNMYEKTGTAVSLLDAMNRLTDALQLGDFYDYNTIKRLATTNPDLDSLMFISMNSFNKMDDNLRETGRSNLSALMIAGVWMESLYLATQAAEQHSNEELKSMIGEQKLILNDLLLILNPYGKEEAIVPYINDLETIRSTYVGVNISYEVGDPQTIEDDGMLMVVQSESSQVTLSDDTLQHIAEVTRQIRNNHMNIKDQAP